MTESIHRLTDLLPLTCSGSISMRELLARINASPYLFQVVVDAQNRLVGTATDGDVRRALLAGESLDAPADVCMQRQPQVGYPGDREGNRRRLAAIRSIVPFLPLVDTAGRPVEILIRRDLALAPAAALVMAGGRGSRLGARTASTPKPLLPVAGQPMLEHVLQRLENAGVEDVYISVNYLGEQIARFCVDRDSRARLHILRETAPTGTAGAVGLLPPDLAGPLLVMNGDVMTDVDLRALLEFYQYQDYDACLAAAHHEVEIPYGVVKADAQGYFESIVEKPKLTHYVAAGIYVLGAEMRRLVPGETRVDMPELLNEGRRAGLRVGVFPIHEYWRDVGRPADLDAADREIAERNT